MFPHLWFSLLRAAGWHRPTTPSSETVWRATGTNVHVLFLIPPPPISTMGPTYTGDVRIQDAGVVDRDRWGHHSLFHRLKDTKKASRSLSQSFLIWGRYFVFLVAHWLEISGIGDVLYTFLHFFYTSMALILWYVLFDITLIIPCITVLPTNAQTGTTLTLKQT